MFWILIYSALLISSLGVFMLLSKKHILSLLIGIELILNGINLIFLYLQYKSTKYRFLFKKSRYYRKKNN